MTAMPTPVSAPSTFLAGCEEAMGALRTLMPATPLLKNAFLSDRYGAEIMLKREDLSPVRSYKLRGAANFFRKALKRDSSLTDFVCASAGNHAQGFAYVVNHLGVTGTVFMPITTPKQKIQKTQAFGGANITVKLIGDTFDQSYAAARTFAAERGATFVPPFDHPDIIEGQASVALEVLAELDTPPDILVVPVGGGGLASGAVKVFARDRVRGAGGRAVAPSQPRGRPRG